MPEAVGNRRDVAAADRLVEAVVVDHCFHTLILDPDTDAEGVRTPAIQIPVCRPYRESVVAGSVDGPTSLELGARVTLVDHEELVASAVESQVAGNERELRSESPHCQLQPDSARLPACVYSFSVSRLLIPPTGRPLLEVEVSYQNVEQRSGVSTIHGRSLELGGPPGTR